jgi:hypothetical protein
VWQLTQNLIAQRALSPARDLMRATDGAGASPFQMQNAKRKMKNAKRATAVARAETELQQRE